MAQDVSSLFLVEMDGSVPEVLNLNACSLDFSATLTRYDAEMVW
jgi:hypothetical protein